MASHRGMDGSLKIIATGGSLSANIGELVSWTLNTSAAILEDTSLGDGTRTRKAGLLDWNASIDLHFDPDDASQDLLVEGAGILAHFEVNNSGGSEETNWEGNTICDSVSWAVNLDGLVSATANLQGNGTLTKTDA